MKCFDFDGDDIDWFAEVNNETNTNIVIKITTFPVIIYESCVSIICFLIQGKNYLKNTRSFCCLRSRLSALWLHGLLALVLSSDGNHSNAQKIFAL